MAVKKESLDEILTRMADTYDADIAPKKIYRKNTNKLYLVLKSIAAGYSAITDAALALQNRFHPLYCDDSDLYSTALMVGTQPKEGTGSLLWVTITNESDQPKTLAAGRFRYTSASGMDFTFQISLDTLFAGLEARMVTAASVEKGAYPVTQITDMPVRRDDGAAIDPSFVFSCADNAGQLGYRDETPFEFRQRILNDANRQDHLKELELKIRNLPNIFECNLVLNDSTEDREYDGVTLKPFELLIAVTGAPTDDMAKLVVRDCLYATNRDTAHPEQVVYYEHDRYLDGKYPVYYHTHRTADFTLDVTYQYDAQKLQSVQVEDAINLLLNRYRNTVTHVDTITERDVYDTLAVLNLPNVLVLDVNLHENGVPIPYLRIAKTRRPNLTAVAFTAVEEGSL
jgi:hypothetical protein